MPESSGPAPIREEFISVQAMSWVIEHSKHKGNSFVVLLMIANHARSDGTGAWPSIPTLAKEARVSDRTVQRTIQRLSRSQRKFKPELEVHPGKGPHGANVYSIPGVKLSPVWGVNLSPVVTNVHQTGDTICHPPGDTAMAPEPSFNHPKDNHPKETPRFACPDWLSQDSWNAFEEMRKRIRAPLTDTARVGIVRELTKLKDKGNDPEEVILQSVTRAWRGVFELRGNGNGQHQSESFGQRLARENDAAIAEGVRRFNQGLGAAVQQDNRQQNNRGVAPTILKH